MARRIDELINGWMMRCLDIKRHQGSHQSPPACRARPFSFYPNNRLFQTWGQLAGRGCLLAVPRCWGKLLKPELDEPQSELSLRSTLYSVSPAYNTHTLWVDFTVVSFTYTNIEFKQMKLH